MKIYGSPRTRSTRVLWVLEEAGAPYEFVSVNLMKGEGREASYLDLNPLGKVPTLVDGDRLIVKPYGGHRIRTGDIVVFQHPSDKYLMVHRVVSAGRDMIRTRGDNNMVLDRFVLSPEEITGRVVSAYRGKKEIPVFGGISGRFQAAMRHSIKHLDLKVSWLLHPLYRRARPAP